MDGAMQHVVRQAQPRSFYDRVRAVNWHPPHGMRIGDPPAEDVVTEELQVKLGICHLSKTASSFAFGRNGIGHPKCTLECPHQTLICVCKVPGARPSMKVMYPSAECIAQT